MKARVIDGKAVAAEVRAQVAKDVAVLRAEHGFTPGLAVVLVGEDPASKVYVKNKGQQTIECGMNSIEHKLPAETTEAEILALVESLNRNTEVNGILVQLPLPKHVNAERVLNAIHPDKDVDGFHPVNVGRLWIGERALVPCTPTGSAILAKSVVPSLAGSPAAARKLHRDNRPFEDQGFAGRVPNGRHSGCSRWHSRTRKARLGEARRHRD
jgi:methylenetetrahydrofolate dehydrogenase (NADP+) / methenyltetrahydrofolate cyclohydrolase